MSIDGPKQNADVRFFGAHDRAWIQSSYCMVFCDKDPNKLKENASPTAPKIASKTQKGFLEALKEKDDYIMNLKNLFGFQSAPFKTYLDVNNLQGHLESMLPTLKDKAQKEKLTLKLVKRQSSNKYQVEPKSNEKSSSSSMRDNKSVYKVVNNYENDEDSEQSKKLQIVICKRKSNYDPDSEKSQSKKQKTSEEHDTSEKVSEVNVVKSLLKRETVQRRGPKMGKRKTSEGLRKMRKSIDVFVPAGTSEIEQLKDESEDREILIKTPPLPVHGNRGRKRAQSTYHRRTSVDNDLQKSKTARRLSASHESKLNKGIEIVKANNPPPYIKTRASNAEKKNTAEKAKEKKNIIETPPPPPAVPSKRGRKPWKNIPVVPPAVVVDENKDKDLKDEQVSVEIIPVVAKKRGPKPKEKIIIKEAVKTPEDPLPEPVFKEPTPEKIPNGTTTKDNTNTFEPFLVIKTEPVSDTEENNIETEIESQRSFSLQDLPNLMTDKPTGTKKIINISTVDDNESSNKIIEHGRARKSFINNVNPKQVEKLSQNRNENWMVSIPRDITSAQSSRTHSPANSISISNRSSPLLVEQTNSNCNSTVIAQVTGQSSSNPIANVQPLNFASQSLSSSRRSTPQTSPNSMKNCLPPPQVTSVARSPENNLPHLIPRPQGVFTQDGAQFSHDVGPVSRMLTDNSHRIADFFKGVLIDTVSSFSTHVPEAENLMLRAENEKLVRDMQVVKSDCQTKMQELRKEHQDEMESLKRNYGKIYSNLIC